MMWICPFVTPDTQTFRYTAAEGMLHLDPQRTQDILWANTQNQFILGSSLLVAPVTEKGARSRTVIFPEGTWVGDDGSRVVGPVTIKIDVPLERLPYYCLQSDS